MDESGTNYFSDNNFTNSLLLYYKQSTVNIERTIDYYTSKTQDFK